MVRQKGFEPPTFWFVAVRDFCILCKRCRKLMVMNEKVGGFLRSCAAPASTVIYCKQYMLAVLLAAAQKSIWLFVSRFLIVGSARRGWRSSFYSLDYIARRVCPQVKWGHFAGVQRGGLADCCAVPQAQVWAVIPPILRTILPPRNEVDFSWV